MVLSRLIRRPPLTLGGRGAAKLNSLYGYTVRVQATAPGGTCRPPAALVGGDFNAARAEFLNAPALFDPAPHLGPFEAACFLEPRLLEVPRDPCPHPVGGLRGQRAEILKFARKLDAAGRLHLATQAEAPRDQRMNLIAVPKNEAVDRIVWDRRRRNWLEAHLVGGARDLPAGYLFTDHEVGDGEVMRLFADDLQDFYPSVVSSAARACTNALAIELTADELAGLRAMRRFGGSPPPRLVPCARSLVMGDVNASDWATEAHAKILGEAGAMPAEERVLHGKPYPRGPVAQALAIDDHVAIANVPLAAGARPVAAPASAPRPKAMSLATATPMPPAVATLMPPSASPSDDVRACFERAGGAYARAGLHRHPAKQRRAEAQGTALGAEILGDAGHIASERLRRLRLADLSLRIATGRYSTGALLRAVVSSWIFALLFRRPLLCLLWECFRALPGLAGGAAADSVVFELPAAVRQELVVLAAMAPAMTSNVRAHPSSTLLATDASDDAIAAVRAPISQELHRELWRVRDRKGWPTHLLGRHGEWLHARGSDRDRADLGESLHAELLQAQACDPERSLVEYFDVMEVFTGPRGPFLQACSRQGLRVGPLIDLQLSAAWDLSEGRLMEWLLFLIQAQRVLYIHLGPPCTSFSLARHPALRSRAFPFGFDPREPTTRRGNQLLLLTLALLTAVRRSPVAAGSWEHPRHAHSWFVPHVQQLLRHEACSTLWFSMCAYGCAYRKDTKFGTVHADFLAPLARPCSGFHKHIVLQGSATTEASEYPEPLCEEWAGLVSDHVARARETQRGLSGDAREASDDDARMRGAVESLLVNEVVLAAPWRQTLCVHTRDRQHINIREVCAYTATVEQQAAECPSSRQVYLLDSLVALGALAKGRSPSRPINNELRRVVPHIVGHDHYPGGLFCPTRHNAADDPTRDREVRLPGLGPDWLELRTAADLEQLDFWAALPLQRRDFSDWARLFLLLLRRSARRPWPWAGRPFDSTLGFPGEGPRPQALPASARLPADLARSRALQPITLARRAVLAQRLEAWMGDHLRLSMIDLLGREGREVSHVLAAYGQHLYDAGLPLGAYLETINAVVDRERSLRRQLQAAWDVAAAWHALVPVSSHIPTPPALLLGMVSLALHWGWVDVAVLIYLGFVAMLRPGEMVALTPGDVLLPTALLSAAPRAYVRVRLPKTRRIAARLQHVRVDDPTLISLLEAWLPRLRPDQRLWAGTAAQFRAAHDELVTFFGVPTGDGLGITPASHRGGGATWLFEQTDDIQRTQWRGRWQSARTLEIYVQEVAAATLLPSLEPTARDRIRLFASLAGRVLDRSIGMLRCAGGRSQTSSAWGVIPA